METQNRTRSTHGPFDIYLVGLGIMGVWHSTREAEDCIRASKQVFYVDHGFGIPEYLASLCPRSTSLLNEYREGKSRLPTYQSMAAIVVDAALEDPPVCFATYGHPTFYVYPSVLIKRAAALLGLRVHVALGISMFDSILVDLDLDPGLAGLQMYEATALIGEDRVLQPDVPCVLLQVDAVESALFTRAPSRAERFVRLQQHLLKFYPPDHQVISIYSATFPILPPFRDQFPLSELPERYAKGMQSGTLYIPPIPKERPRDAAFEQELYDHEHLKRITRPQ